MHQQSWLLLAVAAVGTLASPVEPRASKLTVPLKHKVAPNAVSPKSLVQKGRARLANVNNEDAALHFNVDASSGVLINEDVSYIAPFKIGGTTYDLIVDTGSSNTWCGAQGRCEPSSTGTDTGNTVSVSYGSGSFSGEEYIDSASFGGLTVTRQSIGAATRSTGFSGGVDGILGLGPVTLTQGTVRNTNTVPTFLNNLKAQGSISTEVIGVSFRPEQGSDTDDANGELTLGGTDSSKYSGSISYFPTLTSGSAAPYWGISIAKFTYGSTTLASASQGIVDTGTTLVYIPSAAYSRFLSATGGSTDSSSGLATFSTKPTANFGITFGSKTFTLTPAQYLVPQAQYSVFGLSSNRYYAWINDGGSSGVNTIIGQKFLEYYYSVYDTTNKRIGFATAV